MAKRKLIGLITAVPESIHVKRVLEGICRQCEKYDYDVAVFASLTHFDSGHVDYVKGEKNIYELINFDLLDGVIVDCISFVEDNNHEMKDYIGEKLQRECKKPVVALSLPLNDYAMVQNDDEQVFREIAEHIVGVHGKTDICFLTGPKDYRISEERLEAFQKVMNERGLAIEPEQVFYGNFWYNSGADLAQRIIDEEIPMPQAVVCASDHMAIGLANRLVENGIRVPEDVIVSGFEATQEAAINKLSITSFESNVAKTAADAVDLLHRKIEPARKISPLDCRKIKYIHAGMSCGCAPDVVHSARTFKDSFYYMCYDYGEKDRKDNVDIGMLMEAYVAEQLSAMETPQECLEKICENSFLLRPYTRFYLSLRENWLDLEDVTIEGYPEHMKAVLMTTQEGKIDYAENEKGKVFETKLMLPQIFEEDREEPCIFYFSAVHFQEKTLGYTVLQRTIKEPQKIGVVYRNWLRNVNNSLEMIRAKTRLRELSIYDEMTGAYNRRGMDVMVKKMLKEAKEGDSLFVVVVDMDGLKYVNDNYGHTEGDFGIKSVCNSVKATSRPGEICVRAGGDEFYVLGVGSYEEDEIERRKLSFNEAMERADRTSGKFYPIMASIGCALTKIDENLQVNNVINIADAEMYKNKLERKRHRR